MYRVVSMLPKVGAAGGREPVALLLATATTCCKGKSQADNPTIAKGILHETESVLWCYYRARPGAQSFMATFLSEPAVLVLEKTLSLSSLELTSTNQLLPVLISSTSLTL